MSHIIYSDVIASISELKANPMATIQASPGKSVAILNRNQPVFYCVPAALYEAMLEKLDDLDLAEIVEQRTNELEVAVELDDL